MLRILYVGNFRPSFSTENHIRLTLEAMGHAVKPEQENRTTAKLARGRAEGHDLVLWTRTWGIPGMTPEKWRSVAVPTVSYHLDLYAGLERGRALERDPFWCSRYVFTPDGGSDEFFTRELSASHHWLRAGVFGPECYLASPDPSVACDVTFVGSTEYHGEWPYRQELISWLRSTYGSRFVKHGSPEDTKRGDDLNALYASAKVVVGDTLCLGFTHPRYWSDRVYETLGRGGFLIHPYIEGMELEFTDREHLVYYRYGDWAQLRELVDYYLAHDEERERIRRAGHERVKAQCTYTHRMRELLDIVAAREPQIAAKL